MIFSKIKQLLNKMNKKEVNKIRVSEADFFLANGMIPWSRGYNEYKTNHITDAINSKSVLDAFRKNETPKNFGYRIDERVVEYPWIFSKLSEFNGKILDAGSTFNFDFIVNHSSIVDKDLTIYTFAPEDKSFIKKRISYVFGDLRSLPFKDELYDVIICQSTLEHIDMDNSIYGYEITHHDKKETKSYEYLKVISEFLRVLKSGGTLLLTFPFGKFENHGFFQQIDIEMLKRMLGLFHQYGSTDIKFMKYENEGWRFARQSEVANCISYNPHTGEGKLDDCAAHSRSVACVEFIKNKS